MKTVLEIPCFDTIIASYIKNFYKIPEKWIYVSVREVRLWELPSQMLSIRSDARGPGKPLGVKRDQVPAPESISA
jgi:hypothetical protein